MKKSKMVRENRTQKCIFVKKILIYYHWRRTKVETTGATQDYETLISRLFETFFDFETKKQVLPWHQWHHLVFGAIVYVS